MHTQVNAHAHVSACARVRDCSCVTQLDHAAVCVGGRIEKSDDDGAERGSRNVFWLLQCLLARVRLLVRASLLFLGSPDCTAAGGLLRMNKLIPARMPRIAINGRGLTEKRLIHIVWKGFVTGTDLVWL